MTQNSVKEKYFESKLFKSGNKIKISKLPWGKIGLSICYDLRFPNMYKKMSRRGVSFISVPSAFTETTGKKHWHTLLRARAMKTFPMYLPLVKQVNIVTEEKLMAIH